MNIEKSMKSELNILVSDAKNGSHDAFRLIFEALNDRLFAYAASRTSSREDAADITADTFIDLWRALKNFEYRSEEEFMGFVFKIVKRKLAALYRTKSPTISLELEEGAIPASYEMEIKDYRPVLAHIKELAVNYQELIRLRYWSDLTFREIASLLGTNEATAKVWHHRAIKKLQTNMVNYENII